MSRDINREWFAQSRGQQKGALMGYVREVELVEILDGIFKIARRIARTQLEPEEASESLG